MNLFFLVIFLQLCHVGEPTGWPIAPVICMWRPLDEHRLDVSWQNVPANGHSELQDSQGSNPFRQLWVWMHASAFGEGYNALKSACQIEVII